jgi:glycerol-3-phosphate acyltransferase PlsY
MPYILGGVLSYLLGSISFSWLAVRLTARLDLRKLGTGNLGAKNTMRVIGPLPAILVGILDAGKGWLALFLATQVIPASTLALLLAALLVLTGHNFPLWLKFHGGKGLATLVGIMLFLSPWLLLAMLLLALGALLILKKGNPAAMVAVLCFPLLLSTFVGTVWALPLGSAMAGIILIRHRRDLPDLLSALKR